MSNITDLVLTEGNVSPRELWPGVLMMTQEGAEPACLLWKADRTALAKHCLRQGGRGSSALHFGGTAAALGGCVLSTGEADCHTSPSVPSWILTEHMCSVGGRAWL